MGREIVRTQSSEPGEREFLVDSKDICEVLENNNGTRKVLGIALDVDKITDEVFVHEKAFERMRNLYFLKIYYTKALMSEKETRLHLPEGFNCLSPKLRLLSWHRCPLRCMPSKFCPKNLVDLNMRESKLEKLWEGVGSLTCLKYMNLLGSENLREIPDLSMATNLERLILSGCSSLVEVRRSSIQNLNKLEELYMRKCIKLEILPTGINLKSLRRFNLSGCSRLMRFPDISRNISDLSLSGTAIQEVPSSLRLENLMYLDMQEIKNEKLWEGLQPLGPLITILSPPLNTEIEKLHLCGISSLVELPSSIMNLIKLSELKISDCTNLVTLPSGILLKYLIVLSLSGCLRLKSFPRISNSISVLQLNQTGIEEVPWWIENFTSLQTLSMMECDKLKHVSLNICKLAYLKEADFTDCRGLTEASWKDHRPMVVDHRPKCRFDFMNCLKLDQEALFQQQPVFKFMHFPGEEVPSYFTHRTTNGSSLVIKTVLSQEVFSFQACVVVDDVSISTLHVTLPVRVNCQVRGDIVGNQIVFSPNNDGDYFEIRLHHQGINVVIFECSFIIRNNDNASSLGDVVDIEFVLTSLFCYKDDPMPKIKGCGIRFFGNCPSPNLLEADENSVEGHETEESEDSDTETIRIRKRIRVA